MGQESHAVIRPTSIEKALIAQFVHIDNSCTSAKVPAPQMLQNDCPVFG